MSCGLSDNRQQKQIKVSYICQNNHRARACNLCARGLHYGVIGAAATTLRRDICATLIMVCPGGCQFNKVLLLRPVIQTCKHVPPPVNVTEKCGKIASLSELDLTINATLNNLENNYRSMNEVEDSELYRYLDEIEKALPDSEICGNKIYNYSIDSKIDSKIIQGLSDESCLDTSNFIRDYLPVILLVVFAFLLALCLRCYFMLKGTYNKL